MSLANAVKQADARDQRIRRLAGGARRRRFGAGELVDDATQQRTVQRMNALTRAGVKLPGISQRELDNPTGATARKVKSALRRHRAGKATYSI